MFVAILLIIVGFALLIKGADLLVEGASNIAKRFHIPEIIIGLTIVSIGTSFPELVVSLTSAKNGFPDMAIGNVLGSNICNLLLILGASAIFRPVKFQKETRWIELPMSVFFAIVFMIFCNTGSGISRIEGVLLILLFAGFIIYTIVMGMKGEEFDTSLAKQDTKKTKKIPILKNIIYIIVGIIALKFGGDFTVDNAVFVAEKFGLSEKIISLTILAIGTSLPELVTSITAALKGNSDIAIGNIIGSNIFNMLLIIGATSCIMPIVYNVSYNFDMTIFLISMVILALFPMIPPKNEMSRMNGILYFLGYILYMVALFII